MNQKLILVACMALALAGCGDKGDSSSSAGSAGGDYRRERYGKCRQDGKRYHGHGQAGGKGRGAGRC